MSLRFAILGLVIGLAVACKHDDPFREQCIDSAVAVANCKGYDLECSADCFDECTSRGHKAAKFGDECGEQWLVVHACVADLDCEKQKEWESAHWAGEPGFPCEDQELEFRKKCPDAPLFANDSLCRPDLIEGG